MEVGGGGVVTKGLMFSKKLRTTLVFMFIGRTLAPSPPPLKKTDPLIKTPETSNWAELNNFVGLSTKQWNVTSGPYSDKVY